MNFAAQSMVAESWQNPEHWYETNVVANVKLFEELRKLTSLLKYVHISTPEVYGSCSGIVDETVHIHQVHPMQHQEPLATCTYLACLKTMIFQLSLRVQLMYSVHSSSFTVLYQEQFCTSG